MNICAIFGGSRGIGLTVSKELLKRGHMICILSRSSKDIDLSLFDKNETKPLVLACDVRNETSIQDAFDTMKTQFGKVDVLINCAGINKDNLLLRTNYADIKDIVTTNLMGSILTCKHALSHMLPQRQGVIINIGSILGQKGNSGQSVYSSTKSGLEGFTKTLATEVGAKGIRVNCIAPGFIDTGMAETLSESQVSKIKRKIPLQKMGEPKDIAEVVCFLMQAKYITGQVIHVDGGLSISL